MFSAVGAPIVIRPYGLSLTAIIIRPNGLKKLKSPVSGNGGAPPAIALPGATFAPARLWLRWGDVPRRRPVAGFARRPPPLCPAGRGFGQPGAASAGAHKCRPGFVSYCLRLLRPAGVARAKRHARFVVRLRARKKIIKKRKQEVVP